MKKILLMGNPNVGKSTIFSRLTGTDVITSNYTGTTVEFTKGHMMLGDEKVDVIDVPGVYTLEPASKAEEAAFDILKQGIDIIVNVIDSTNLERNLNLTLQLLKTNIPVVAALNFCDETKHCGILINAAELEKLLGVPVISVCGRTGEGIKELVDKFKEAKVGTLNYAEEEKWHIIGNIATNAQKLFHKHHTFLNRMEDISIQPLTGIPFAVFVLLSTFKIVRFVGEGIVSMLDPIFTKYYFPFITNIIVKFFTVKFIQDLFLGTSPKIMESFGVLTTGIYIPIVVVLPYIFAFYLVLSLLEDIGYLPRLAVLLDVILHKIGVHGYTSIPILLGLGCKVPGILATRILETSREKIIAAVMILIAAPCMPQTAMIISLIGPYGVRYLILIFGVLFIVSVVSSFLLNKILKGETPELFVEIPPYRVPYIPALIKKLWIRLKSFVFEAVPMIIIGVFIISIFDALGINNFIAAKVGSPILSILGLPVETISVIMLGFLRKDISIAMLVPLGLNIKQMIVASVFLTMYLPCIATFFVLLKEMGIKKALMIVMIIFFISMITAAALNFIL